ncbi:MAG: hypothetical protein R2867_24065 [Caldilineaceae bacterium]
MNGAIAEGMHFRGLHIRDGLYLDLGTYDEIMKWIGPFNATVR